jgi:hypothetical protein
MGHQTTVATSALTPANRLRTIHVTAPTKVLFDLDSFVKIQKDILGRLGHLACTSGFDIRWEFVDRFQIDEKLQLTELMDNPISAFR